ncbi:MAG: PEP/pyruvate-binding domain-containing protein [Candidatus Nanopelagicales bacterium]
MNKKMKLLTTSFLVVVLSINASQGFTPSVRLIRKATTISAHAFEHENKIASSKKTRYCIPLDEINLHDLPSVGGKTASLGEMIQQLTPLGVQVPSGFGVSSAAYDAVLDRFQLRERLDLLLKDVDVNNLDDLASKFI